MSKCDIGIVIVSYNCLEKIKFLVNSLVKFGAKKNFQIVIVDNYGELTELQAAFFSLDQVQVFSSNGNVGFGRACNYGFSKIDAEYVLFLNPDMEIYDDSVFNFIRIHRDIKERIMGLDSFFIGGCMHTAEGVEYSSVGNFPSIADEIKLLLGLKIYPRKKYLDEFPNKEVFEVEYVTGAMMFMSSFDFIKCKGFHSSYFLYYEETDLQYQMYLQGWKSYFCEKIKGVHENGGTHSSSESRDKFLLEGKLNYINRNFSGAHKRLMLFFLSLLRLKWKIRDRLRSNII